MRAIQRKVHANFSPEEASRAIYVDFEGFKDKTPSLVGILVDGVLTQVVLDPRLLPAAVVKGCKTDSIHEVAHNLRERCQAEGRKLVAYSDLPPLNSTTSRERIWEWSKPREATNATRKEGTG